MSSRGILLKPIRLASEVTESLHREVSRGYYETTPEGEKKWVSYTRNELGEIHSFISPGRVRYKRMKWTKTKDWKDKAKAKKAHFKYHPTYGGLNTKPK